MRRIQKQNYLHVSKAYRKVYILNYQKIVYVHNSVFIEKLKNIQVDVFRFTEKVSSIYKNTETAISKMSGDEVA